jgi:hypothetical protein
VTASPEKRLQGSLHDVEELKAGIGDAFSELGDIEPLAVKVASARPDEG